MAEGGRRIRPTYQVFSTLSWLRPGVAMSPGSSAPCGSDAHAAHVCPATDEPLRHLASPFPQDRPATPRSVTLATPVVREAVLVVSQNAPVFGLRKHGSRQTRNAPSSHEAR